MHDERPDELTEEERLREEARASELRFREVVEHATDAIVLSDGSGVVTYFNAAAERMFGYGREEMLGAPASLLVPPELRTAHEAGIRRYAASSRPSPRTRHHEGLHKDGSHVPVECTVSATARHGDTIVTAILRDVTERRRTEAALTARARQQEIVAALGQRALTGESPEALLEGAVRRVSDVYDGAPCLLHRVTGPDGALELRASASLDPRVCRDVGALLGSRTQAAFTLRAAGPVVVDDLREERRFSPAPTLLEHGLTSSLSVPIQGAPGPWGVLCVHRDGRRFTEDDTHFLQSVGNVLGSALARRATRTELRRSERSFRSLIERLPDAIAVHREGRFVYVNHALATQLGYDAPEDLIGQPLTRVVHPDSWPKVRARLALLEEGGEAAPLLEERIIHRDGTVMPVEVAAIRVDFDGQPAVVAVARDLTERHELTARMMQMDRMVAVGTLAAGVGHEINNPLAWVSANVDMALDRLTPVQRAVTRMAEAIRSELGEDRLGDLLREAGEERLLDDLEETLAALREAHEGSRRIRDVVRDLKSFSRAEDLYGPVPVDGFLRAAVNMAWNEVRHRARLVEDLEDVPLVHGNEGRLAQVFLNLLVNAAQALPEGRADDHEVRLRARHEGARVIIEVSDTGPGIPDDVRDRIFDPFFTTKPVGQGTGLGLAIGRRIVEGHHGTVEVDSRPGRTTFRVGLPVAREEIPGAGEPSSVETLPADPDSPPRVLVVDDEAPVGRMIVRMLRKHADVRAVTTSRAALTLLQEERWDAVICDVMLPDMAGMDLYEAVDPAVRDRFVFVTGGAFTPRARAFLERSPAPVLDKPVDARDLQAALSALLTA